MSNNHLFRVIMAAAVGLLALVVAPPISSSVTAQGASTPPASAQSGGISAVSAATPAATPVPGGPRFYAVSPFSFRPVSQSQSYDYSGGTLYTSTGGVFEAPLSLPDKITVTKLVIYFYDNLNTDIQANLYRCPLLNSVCIIMASVDSTGAQSAYRSVVTTTISSPLVDQQSASYLLEVILPAGNQVGLTGARVDYAFNVSLPLVLKSP